MAENIFGMDWRKFAPHPVFNEWLPFATAIISIVGSLVGLAVTLLNFEKLRSGD